VLPCVVEVCAVDCAVFLQLNKRRLLLLLSGYVECRCLCENMQSSVGEFVCGCVQCVTRTAHRTARAGVRENATRPVLPAHRCKPLTTRASVSISKLSSTFYTIMKHLTAAAVWCVCQHAGRVSQSVTISRKLATP